MELKDVRDENHILVEYSIVELEANRNRLLLDDTNARSAPGQPARVLTESLEKIVRLATAELDQLPNPHRE